MRTGFPRESMSPESRDCLLRYMGAYSLVTTPKKRGSHISAAYNLIDNTSGLVWKDLLEQYSYDFDWDNFQKKNWASLEERCQIHKKDYSEEDYERFRITELLKEFFISNDSAQLNFTNLIKRIFEAKQYDLAKKVSHQIIKLHEYEYKKKKFQDIYERVKTEQIAYDSLKNRILRLVGFKSLVNRCKPKESLNLKKIAIIGTIVSLTFGVSYAAWKNYFAINV